MKTILASELRKHDINKLLRMVSELKHEHMNLRFQKSGSKLEKTSSIRTVCKNIACIKTILTEKFKEKS
jgi:ribosomal protein L29